MTTTSIGCSNAGMRGHKIHLEPHDQNCLSRRADVHEGAGLRAIRGVPFLPPGVEGLDQFLQLLVQRPCWVSTVIFIVIMQPQPTQSGACAVLQVLSSMQQSKHMDSSSDLIQPALSIACPTLPAAAVATGWWSKVLEPYRTLPAAAGPTGGWCKPASSSAARLV